MPTIELEASEEFLASVENEARLTGYTVKAILVRWITSGQLNAGPLLRLKCSSPGCDNPRPTWWHQKLREYVCRACAEKACAEDPRREPFPVAYDSRDRFRDQLTREEYLEGRS